MWLSLLWVAASAVAQDTPSTCPETELWPTTQWAESLADPASPAVQAFEDYAFAKDLDWSDKERKGIRTDGVVVIKDGQIVYERYANGYTKGKKHLTWSVSKTFMSMLAGVAVAEGRLSLSDSICTQFEGIPEANCAITLLDALEFGTGLRWAETYEDSSPVHSSVLAMLYGEGWQDMARFVANHELIDKPGTTYRYSSGDANLVAGMVGKVMTEPHGERWPWKVLFEPIGMSSVTFERDGSGTFVGSSWLWTTPRDMARFGYFMLNDGCWEGQRLLPEGWVADATVPSGAIQSQDLDGSFDSVNGRQVWLNRVHPDSPDGKLPWPDVPEGAYAARGHWKQAIFVSPEDNVVIIRTGDDRDGTFSWNTFLSLALAITEAP